MLNTLLQEKITATHQLMELLIQEYNALKAHSLNDLEQVLNAKQTAMVRLQGLSAQLADHLQRQGFGSDAAGLQACIAGHAPEVHPALEASRAVLADIALRTGQQNDINGVIIAASRSHTERALSILRGRNAQHCLYDHGAQTTFSGGSHSLIKA